MTPIKVIGAKKFSAIETAVSIDHDAAHGRIKVTMYADDGNGGLKHKACIKHTLPKEEIDALLADENLRNARGAKLVGVTLADAPAVEATEAPLTTEEPAPAEDAPAASEEAPKATKKSTKSTKSTAKKGDKKS